MNLLDERLARLTDGYEEGVIPKEEFSVRARSLRAEKTILARQLDSLEAKLSAIRGGSLNPAAWARRFDVFRESFGSLPLGEQKKILHNLVDHIVVHPDGSLEIFIYQPVVGGAFRGKGGKEIGEGETGQAFISAVPSLPEQKSPPVIPPPDYSAPLIKIDMKKDADPPSIPLSNFPTFAHRLQYLRVRQGLSKAGLAKILGVNKCSPANWEIRNVVPEGKTGRKLARVLGVEYGELIGRRRMEEEDEGESGDRDSRLKNLREYHGYTQKEMAGILGMTVESYAYREKMNHPTSPAEPDLSLSLSLFYREAERKVRTAEEQGENG